MSNPLSKTPFLFLLLSLLAGILIQYFWEINTWGILFLSIGGIIMLYSFLVPPHREYSLRWLFGSGSMLFVMALGMMGTAHSQQQASYNFSGKHEIYKGVVASSGKTKGNTLSYNVHLPQHSKDIVCYIAIDSLNNRQLCVGDIFLFNSKIDTFRNSRQNKEFDYVRYMHNKGFAGSSYISHYQWHKVAERSSLKIYALQVRSHILSFYQSLGFTDTQYAILSALTLGYQDSLSEDIVQAFRTTGTVHVLSVSGLHVGLVYAAIALLLSAIRHTSNLYRFRSVLIIFLLWCYAFVTGLSPSVVRASIMLSVFCASELFGKRSYAVHAMYIAAFFMLLINPLSFFDIGFQLSFASVFAILYLHPSVSQLPKTNNKYIKHIWQLFTLSLVAQLACFPLCLYYFGTFPSYFFVANLIIVPLVSLIIYAMLGIIAGKCLSLVLVSQVGAILFLPTLILKFLTNTLAMSIDFFQGLPYALVQDVFVTPIELLFLSLSILGLSHFYIYHRSYALNISLISAVGLLLHHFIYNL